MMMSAFDHAILRCLKKDKPFFLMESAPAHVNWMVYNKLKRPHVHDQFSCQTIAR
ncbi:MAG: beta-galactosidase [Lachnospiraceae bacterium]|nr:beta-galactosidase [Lachnospiraceae bacterium]